MNVYRLSDKFERFKHKFSRHSALTMYDNSRLNAEGCRGVNRLGDNVIELVLAQHSVTIVGLDMKMRNYAFDCVCITGTIHSVTFDSTKTKTEEQYE